MCPMKHESVWRECPHCTTHIPICARCGKDYPDRSWNPLLSGFVSWPPGYTHLTSNRDIRLCGRCVEEFRYIAHVWAGEPTDELVAMWKQFGFEDIPRYQLIVPACQTCGSLNASWHVEGCPQNRTSPIRPEHRNERST